MKAVVSKADLVSVTGKMQGVIAPKPTLPILANVLVEAIDDQLVVSGTDLSVSIRCYIDAKVLEEGAIALPARRFFQLIRELTSPQIKLSAPSHEIAEITTGSSVFKINGMNRSEFPPFADLSALPEIRLPSHTLKQLLMKTIFSAAREDNRYMLNGLFLRIGEQKVTAIGTDGKRLSKTTAPFTGDPATQGSYVIPLKAAEEMMKLLDGSEGEAHLFLSQDKLSLEYGPHILIAKLLAGTYPDVEKVIPKEVKHSLVIHREELMILLKQISLFTSETSSSVRFRFETGQLHLMAMSNEVGEGRVSMPVDYAGAPIEIAFNPHFFLDILRHCQEETIHLGLGDPHNPGLVTEKSESQFVIMPMRLHESAPQRKEESLQETV